MAKQIGLGKGLDALLSASKAVPLLEGKKKNKMANMDVELLDQGMQNIALDKIKISKYQPRKNFDENELADLAGSIRHNGVIQPIIVRRSKQGFELIAGERRLRACKMANIKKIPAIVRELDDKDALAVALIENIQRKDLNVVEEADGYRRLIDEFKLTHEELATATGRSRSHITNILRLLNLDPDVLALLLAGHMSMGHARALLSLPSNLQMSLAKDIINGNLTTSEVERRVARLLHGNTIRKVKARAIPPDILQLETKIAKKLGMTVNIKPGRKGNGKITITYDSEAKLKNLLKLI